MSNSSRRFEKLPRRKIMFKVFSFFQNIILRIFFFFGKYEFFSQKRGNLCQQLLEFDVIVLVLTFKISKIVVGNATWQRKPRSRDSLALLIQEKEIYWHASRDTTSNETKLCREHSKVNFFHDILRHSSDSWYVF